MVDSEQLIKLQGELKKLLHQPMLENMVTEYDQKGPKGESNNETMGNKRHLTWQSHFNWISDPLVKMNLYMLKSLAAEEEDADVRAPNMKDFKDDFEQVKGAATTKVPSATYYKPTVTFVVGQKSHHTTLGMQSL